MTAGILELDLHGSSQYQARIQINAALRRAGRDVYRIRLVHGYRGGTALRDMIRREYRSHPKILRLEMGLNPGETDLVLRDWL